MKYGVLRQEVNLKCLAENEVFIVAMTRNDYTLEQLVFFTFT